MEEVLLPDFQQTYAQRYNSRRALHIVTIVVNLVVIGITIYTVGDIINKRIKQKNKQR